MMDSLGDQRVIWRAGKYGQEQEITNEADERESIEVYDSTMSAQHFGKESTEIKYSPPPFINHDEFEHIDSPGIRDQCWLRCTLGNDALSPESMMTPKEIVLETVVPQEIVQKEAISPEPQPRIGRPRTCSTGSRASRLLTTFSISSERSIGRLKNAFHQITRTLSTKTHTFLDHVKLRKSEKTAFTHKASISRPLSRMSWFDGVTDNPTGVHRVDFVAAQDGKSRKVDSATAQDQDKLLDRLRETRLRRQPGTTDLRRPAYTISKRSSGHTDSDYLSFLAAAIANDASTGPNNGHAEISSLAKLENSDDISVIIQDYIGRSTISGPLIDRNVVQSIEVRSTPHTRRYATTTKTQETLKRNTWIETGEHLYFF